MTYLRAGGFDPDNVGPDFDDEPPPDSPDPTPIFTVEHGIYTAAFPASFVAMEFDIFRTGRDGDLSAEVVARSTAPGLSRQLHRGRVVMNGTRSRSDLAKHLASRTQGMGIDWPELIEQATVWALERYREGEPAMLLKDAPEPLVKGFALSPIVLARHLTIWYGLGGAGKSMLALGAAASIQTGKSFLGVRPTMKLTCAYLDWELDAWEQRERLRLIAGEPLPDIVYVRGRGAIWDEADRLRRIFRDRGVGFAVIDSIGMACGGAPIEESETAMRFENAINRLEVGTLAIAHRTREGTDEFPFGSIFWHNNARATWLVKNESEPGSEPTVVGMFNKKANTGPRLAPLAFEMVFEPNVLRIRRREAADVPEMQNALPTNVRMRRALRTGPQLVNELAVSLDLSYKAVWMCAKRMTRVFILTGEGEQHTTVALRADD